MSAAGLSFQIQLHSFMRRWAWVLVVIFAGLLILSRVQLQHRITLAEYSALRERALGEHITQRQAFEALGRVQCEETFRTSDPNLTRASYSCSNSDGSDVHLMFDDGRLVATGADGLY